jgi:HSP20 family molecular chaperone IbpA
MKMNEANKTVATKNEQAEIVALYPLTDIYENKEGVSLYIDLPGVSKETLEIDVDQDILTIKGKISLKTEETLSPTFMEIRSKLFERRFTLGDELDTSQIEAKLNQGELKLSIPRLEQHKPKKINIRVA